VQLRNLLRQSNPEIVVEGDEYPVTSQKQLIAKVIGFIQMGLFAVILVGQGLTDPLGISDFAPVKVMQENKMMSCFVTFMLCNNLIGMCI